MLTLWGVVTATQGVVHNYGGLLACRFFLGLLEGRFHFRSLVFPLLMSHRWSLPWTRTVPIVLLPSRQDADEVCLSLQKNNEQTT